MYNLFISHSWKYNSKYDNLVNLLKEYPYFNFKNYFVPSSDPLDISGKKYESKLKATIRNQMKSCHVVLVIAGKYVSYSGSIQMEIDLAEEMKKPIIAIEPWGAAATSQVAKESSCTVVGWNSNSIVDAIRQYSI